jgi:glycosyltransferase involved in cell wall biosynthesis
MRVCITTWSNGRVGGIETYLSKVIPELARAGLEVGFFHETGTPTNRKSISLQTATRTWSVDELGRDGALAGLRKWQPDVLYSHGLRDPELEAQILDIAPAVFFLHSYYGTCISGGKTFKSPTIRPCECRFGWPCLLRYYPRRCGGWNPLSMVREYQRQHDRLELLTRYKAILAHSAHMVDEYAAHGLRVQQIAHPIEPAEKTFEWPARSTTAVQDPELYSHASTPWRLLFIGRMDQLKGGRILLQALPRVVDILRRPVSVVFAGDGPDRGAWERIAQRLSSERPDVTGRFVGWKSAEAVTNLLDDADLLVLPSLWPEPFGQVGIEAGHRAVPVAAFAVGGINEWLIDGINGHLAAGDPPTAVGLSDAIASCLSDPKVHSRLRRGALEVAQRFSMKRHLAELLSVLEATAQHAS